MMATEVRTQLSDLIRSRRAELRLSLRELADRAIDEPSGAEVKLGYLHKLESAADNVQAPREGQLRALARGLNLPLALLQDAAAAQFFGVDTTRSEDTEARAMMLTIEGMTPEDRAKVKALLEAWGPAVSNRSDGS